MFTSYGADVLQNARAWRANGTSIDSTVAANWVKVRWWAYHGCVACGCCHTRSARTNRTAGLSSCPQTNGIGPLWQGYHETLDDFMVLTVSR